MFRTLSGWFRRSDAVHGPAAAGAARCFHCGLPLPSGARDHVTFDGVAHTVCCAACATVAETVICNGYGDYYRERDRLAAPV